MFSWFSGLAVAVQKAIIVALLAALAGLAGFAFYLQVQVWASEVKVANAQKDLAQAERDLTAARANRAVLEEAIKSCNGRSEAIAAESASRIKEAEAALAKARAEAAGKNRRAVTILEAPRPSGMDACAAALDIYRRERER